MTLSDGECVHAAPPRFECRGVEGVSDLRYLEVLAA